MKYPIRRSLGSLYVPPDESDAPRRVKRCDKGHEFSTAVADCPTCRYEKSRDQNLAEIERIRASEMRDAEKQRSQAEHKRRASRIRNLKLTLERCTARAKAAAEELQRLEARP